MFNINKGIGGDDSNNWFIWIKYSIMKLKF
mgnify:CR=1 FL=1